MLHVVCGLKQHHHVDVAKSFERGLQFLQQLCLFTLLSMLVSLEPIHCRLNLQVQPRNNLHRSAIGAGVQDNSQGNGNQKHHIVRGKGLKQLFRLQVVLSC